MYICICGIHTYTIVILILHVLYNFFSCSVYTYINKWIIWLNYLYNSCQKKSGSTYLDLSAWKDMIIRSNSPLPFTHVYVSISDAIYIKYVMAKLIWGYGSVQDWMCGNQFDQTCKYEDCLKCQTDPPLSFFIFSFVIIWWLLLALYWQIAKVEEKFTFNTKICIFCLPKNHFSRTLKLI